MGITEAELLERKFSVQRHRELSERVKKREDLLHRLEFEKGDQRIKICGKIGVPNRGGWKVSDDEN